MATVNVTDENFEAEVIKAGKPVIVDFWAEWCGPCKQIGPILEEISNEMSDVVIAKHNIDNEPNTPTRTGKELQNQRKETLHRKRPEG
jgi:thioredoxin 1